MVVEFGLGCHRQVARASVVAELSRLPLELRRTDAFPNGSTFWIPRIVSVYNHCGTSNKNTKKRSDFKRASALCAPKCFCTIPSFRMIPLNVHMSRMSFGTRSRTPPVSPKIQDGICDVFGLSLGGGKCEGKPARPIIQFFQKLGF